MILTPGPWASCSETIEVSSVVDSLPQSQHEGLTLLSMSNPGDVSNGARPGFFDYLGQRLKLRSRLGDLLTRTLSQQEPSGNRPHME